MRGVVENGKSKKGVEANACANGMGMLIVVSGTHSRASKCRSFSTPTMGHGTTIPCVRLQRALVVGRVS